MTERHHQEYRTAIAIVADEIWLNAGGKQDYCTVLTKQRLQFK